LCECTILCYAGKSPWVRRKAEGEWVGRTFRWTDGGKRDAERLGMRNWRTKAMGREGWRLVIESVKTLHGL
jgi:hypothetical protein